MKILRRSFLILLTLFSTLAISADKPESGKVLRIGFQKSGAFLLVKTQASLEARLKPLGYSVEWKEFSAGVPLLEALRSGGLDIGHTGDAPAVLAQASGAPVVYFGHSNESPESVGIAVPKDSAISSVSGLKGKKVAVGKGSSAHFFLVKALEKGGLAYSDITPVFLNPPEARAAFDSGTVDAWAVWDPFLASAETKASARVLASGKGASPFREFYLAHESFAKNESKILVEVLAELEAAGAEAKKDPAKIAAFLSQELKLDLPTLEKSELRKFRYGAKPLSDAVIAEQQAVADLFASLNLIPKKIVVREAVWAAPSK
jgi:sulfonate transport system substrate-binding protein